MGKKKVKAKATAKSRAVVPVQRTGNELLDLARDPAVDPAKLKSLIDMKNEDLMQAAKTAYAVAMSDAQAQMEPVRKDCENKQTRSKYASYAALDRAIRRHYVENGFALEYNTETVITHDSPEEFRVMRVVCDVSHKAGFSKHFQIDIPIVTKGPQGKEVMTATHATMSANTYGKRGLLKMIFNIAEYDEDDDGNAAAGGRLPISESSLKTLTDKLESSGADVAAFCQWMGVESLNQITEGQLGKAMVGLEQKAKMKKETA